MREITLFLHTQQIRRRPGLTHKARILMRSLRELFSHSHLRSLRG